MSNTESAKKKERNCIRMWELWYKTGILNLIHMKSFFPAADMQ